MGVSLLCLTTTTWADTATPLVIGTTSLHGAAIGAIDAAANRVPIVCSANMSPGVNVLISLLKKTANALPDHEVEIVELHHRHKKDAPSGTALLLADTIESARGRKSDLRLGRSVATLALAHRLRRQRVLHRRAHRRPRA